jgi:PhnB protein
MAVKPIPDNYPRVTPYLAIDGAAAAIDFYKKAFGATERLRMPGPDGKIGHAEIEIEGALIMMADEYPPMNFRSPKAIGGSPVMMHMYVSDVDAFFRRAKDAGAEVLREPTTQFYGDRSCSIKDPFGHLWSVATHVEDVSEAELKKRSEKHAGGG